MSSAEISGEGKHYNPSPAGPDEAVNAGADERIGGMDDDKTQFVSEKDIAEARAQWKARRPDLAGSESQASPTGEPPSSRPPQVESPSSAAIPTSTPALPPPTTAAPARPAADLPPRGGAQWGNSPHPAVVARQQDRRSEAYQGPNPGPQPWGQHTGQFQQAQPTPPQQGYAPQPGPAPRGFGQAAVVANGTLTDGLAAKLRQEAFTTEVKPRPESGWRKAVLKGSFGLINPGESRIERIDRERRAQVGANIPRTEFIFAVMSPRGGVAKTTTTAALGSMFAKIRSGDAIVIDADSNKGSLASRVNPEARATHKDLLADANIRGVSDIRQYAKPNGVYLDVLAGDESNVAPQVYDATSLVKTIDVLRGRYSVIGIDVGQNLQDPVVAQILDMVTAVVVVSGLWYGAGKAAVGMYDWLVENGRGDLVQRSTLVISDRHPELNKAFKAGVEENVASTLWKDPVYIPYDHHLYEDTVINLDQLAKPTYRAYLETAARLSSYYGQPALPRRRSA